MRRSREHGRSPKTDWIGVFFRLPVMERRNYLCPSNSRHGPQTFLGKWRNHFAVGCPAVFPVFPATSATSKNYGREISSRLERHAIGKFPRTFANKKRSRERAASIFVQAVASILKINDCFQGKQPDHRLLFGDRGHNSGGLRGVQVRS